MTQIAEPTSNGLIPARVNGGLFLQGFAGSAVLLLAIDATEPLFFGPGYFAGLTYHPFWIVILLAAVQHGLFVGLSVVGLAALLMDWPTRPWASTSRHIMPILPQPLHNGCWSR